MLEICNFAWAFLFGDGSSILAFQALPMMIPAIMSLVGTGLSIANSQGAFGKPEVGPGSEPGGVPSGGAATAMSPAASPDEYKSNANAYWQNMFAGTGQGLPGGQLPESIQAKINRQADLLKG